MKNAQRLLALSEPPWHPRIALHICVDLVTPTRQFLCAVRDDGADQEPRHGTSHASATAQLPEADEGCGAQGTPGVLSFPDGYPEGAAREIVTQLLHATPAERLGADRCAQILSAERGFFSVQV